MKNRSKELLNLQAILQSDEDFVRGYASYLQKDAAEDLENLGRYVDDLQPKVEARAVFKQQLAGALLDVLDGEGPR